MKALKAVYNFIVGDWIILIGVLLVIALLAVINLVGGLAALRNGSGIILTLAVLVILVASLSRETRGRR